MAMVVTMAVEMVTMVVARKAKRASWQAATTKSNYIIKYNIFPYTIVFLILNYI